MSPDEGARRINCAREYFDFLMLTSGEHWEDLYRSYKASEMTLAQKATLVSPRRLAINFLTPDRKARTFKPSIPNYEKSHSTALYGYQCPFEQHLETDHLFPWALGGPTHPENAIYLCRDHNRAKGHDLHLVPWTPESMEWLDREIEVVARTLQVVL